jgi:hypothetical protein
MGIHVSPRMKNLDGRSHSGTSAAEAAGFSSLYGSAKAVPYKTWRSDTLRITLLRTAGFVGHGFSRAVNAHVQSGFSR